AQHRRSRSARTPTNDRPAAPTRVAHRTGTRPSGGPGAPAAGRLRSPRPTSDRGAGPAVPGDPVLACRDLEKRFGDVHAVRGVSSAITTGETYGLLGPNGAGKTTTISMVCGLLERDRGEVVVDGMPVDVTSVRA